MNGLIRFFVERPRVVSVATVVIILMGLISLGAVRYESFPKVAIGAVNVTTVHPGYGPEDIELSITEPIEDEVLEVGGVERVTSASMEGLSVVTARLDPDLDEEGEREAVSRIREAVDRARARLPAALLEDPDVRELSSGELPLAEVHVTGDVPEATLRDVARLVAAGARELPGVGQVGTAGLRDREVRVALDPVRADRLGVAADEVEAAFALRNVRDTGGALDAVLGRKNVVTVAAAREPGDVADIILRGGDEAGNVVRVRDVADVLLDYEDWQVQQRLDGRLSIAVQVRSEEGADGLEVADALRAFVATQRERLPAGVELVIVNDVSRFTRDLLSTLVSNAAIGLVLLLLVLRVFFRWRLAFWVAMGLPISAAITFAAMAWLDVSVNLLTLTAMVLVLGMLVDDAIVTGESIDAHRARDPNSRRATIRGTEAISRPVLVSSLTTVLAFVPMAFLGGLEGKFMWGLPVVVSLALGASLLDSKLLLPSHLVEGPPSPPTATWFARLQQRYRVWLETFIRRPWLAVLVFVAAAAGILTVSTAAMRFNLYPEMEVDVLMAKIELPEGASQAHTVDKAAEVEALVREVFPDSDVANVATQIGHHDTDIYGATEGRNEAWALVTVYLSPLSERTMGSLDGLAELRERGEALTGFASVVIEPLKDTPVAGKPVELSVIGDEGRGAVVGPVVQWLEKHPGVTSVTTSDKAGKSNLRLELDHGRMRHFGLSVRDVSRAVRVGFDGVVVGQMRTTEERMSVRVVLDESRRGDLDTLLRLRVPNERGEMVALRSFASVAYEAGQAALRHENGDRVTTVYADIDRAVVDTASINAELKAFVAEEGLLRGRTDLRLRHGGELEQQQEAMGDFGVAALFAIVAIASVLILLFDSLIQPLLILAVVPFGIVGVFAGFALQGFELSLMALIGILGLAGVLVNDAVVLVSRLNDLRRAEGGAPLTSEQIARGASERLRPIVITSVTTVAGLMPTAYGIAGNAAFIAPMVMAIAWGVLFGTLITLVLLPAMVAIHQRLIGRLMRRKASKERTHDDA